MKQIRYLNSIRGIACLIVMLAHWWSTHPKYGFYVSGCGKIGVWCFMLLSGFFMMLPYTQGKAELAITEWYRKKIVRIYPSYLIVLLLSACVGFLAFQDIPAHLLALRGDGHFWFMPVILRTYLFFPLFFNLRSLIKNNLYYCIVLVGIGVLLSLIFPYTRCPENDIHAFWYMPVFILGMLLAFIYSWQQESGRHESVLFDLLALLSIIGIFLLTPFMSKLCWDIEPTPRLQNKYLQIGGLWAIALFGIFKGKYIKLILSKAIWLQKIGTISFQLYLVHYVILIKIKSWNDNMIVRGISMALLSIAAAKTLCRIEQIIAKYMRKRNTVSL